MSGWLLIACQLVCWGGAGTALAAEPLSGVIDAHLARAHEAARIVPSPAADDAAFLRRVSLDLIGRIPTAEEVLNFLQDVRTGKREALVERLLRSPEHSAHFARTWRGLLLPEAESDRQLQYLVPGFESWLRDQRSAGRSFGEMVRSLVAVPITGTSERPQLVVTDLRAPNPMAFIASKGANPAALAGSTTRLFLGLQLECAQCHDHPFDQWTQVQFWQQAAFFSGIERRGRGTFAPVLERTDLRTISVMTSEDVAAATFLDGQPPVESDGQSPRAALADWIVSSGNPYFSRAISNRIWGELMGLGVVDPVDDMHTSNPPSHPELLQDLADAFVTAGGDLDVLYRGICGSRAYQRTSRQTDPSQADPRAFARMGIKSLSGEQFATSFLQAVRLGAAERAEESSAGDEPLRRRILQTFGQSAGIADPETSVAQTLALMNGVFVDAAVDPDSSRPLSSLVSAHPGDASHPVEWLYLNTLSRFPSAQEAETAREYVVSGEETDHARRLGDVLWALLNSAEFRWNH
jgi:hypothetical protein